MAAIAFACGIPGWFSAEKNSESDISYQLLAISSKLQAVSKPSPQRHKDHKDGSYKILGTVVNRLNRIPEGLIAFVKNSK
jgi:hypothetical protein